MSDADAIQTPFVIVPKWILPLGWKAISVYTAIASFSDAKGESWPSHASIAEAAGISVSTVQSGLLLLRDRGAVVIMERRREDGGRSSNAYFLRMDDPSVPRVDTHRSGGRGGVGPADRAELDTDEREPSPDGEGAAGSPGRDEEGADERVDALCAQLATHVVEVAGGSRPGYGKAWRRECRLMLEKDGWTVDQVSFAIRWLAGPTKDAIFWKTNVLSMPTLREKMRVISAAIRAEKEARGRPGSAAERTAQGQQNADDFREAARRMREVGLG